MGAFLSLPMVGYLLMPSVTSYSTSLNLLFFYMVSFPITYSRSLLKVALDVEHVGFEPLPAQS
jgi:hypothetical protein